MTYKFSVQFERFDNDPTRLLCNALVLSDDFCRQFPVSTGTGYLAYKKPPSKQNLPEQEFWFAVVEAKKKEDAYNKAIKSLIHAELDKPFPAHLSLVDDDVYKIN